jgi:hypothetical protein
MYFNITEANYVGNHEIKLNFEDGSVGKVDLSKYIEPGTLFEKLRDIEYFKSFQIEYGTLIWGKGELDIAPETLYSDATGKTVTYQTRKEAVS